MLDALTDPADRRHVLQRLHPYRNAWLKRLTPFNLQTYPVEAYADRLAAQSSAIPSLKETLIYSSVQAP